MKYKFIENKNNKTYKFFKSLFLKKYREKNNLFIFEGKKLFKESLMENVIIEDVICSEKFFKENEFYKFFDILQEKKLRLTVLSDAIFNSLTEMTNSEGIITISKFIKDIKISSDNIILLDKINDPGNFGTIIRCANAFGIKDILTLDCVDKYNPKVLRASMGGFFRVNILKIDFNKLLDLKNYGYKIISTTLNEKSKNLEKFSFNGKNIIVMGNEANGVSKEILEISDEFLKIDIKNSMESLNVSIATAIIMNEIFKKNK